MVCLCVPPFLCRECQLGDKLRTDSLQVIRPLLHILSIACLCVPPSLCSECQLGDKLAPSTDSMGLNTELATVFRKLAEKVAGAWFLAVPCMSVVFAVAIIHSMHPATARLYSSPATARLHLSPATARLHLLTSCALPSIAGEPFKTAAFKKVADIIDAFPEKITVSCCCC